MALNRAVGAFIQCLLRRQMHLAAKAVESTALAFESIDHVHGGDGLALCMFSVRHSIADDVLQEHLQHTPSLLVDETGDAFYTTTTRKTPNGRLCNALDVIAQYLPVTLGSSLSEAFSTLTTLRRY